MVVVWTEGNQENEVTGRNGIRATINIRECTWADFSLDKIRVV